MRLLLLAAVFAAALRPAEPIASFGYIADLHVGEGCNSSATGYTLNDTQCYSVQNLKATVAKINSVAVKENLKIVIVGGDVTSSAQPTQFEAARQMLDALVVPYIAIMGNHDVWWYTPKFGDMTTTPIADKQFASTFAESFKRAATLGTLVYPNQTVYNPTHECNSTFSSWQFTAGPFLGGDDLNGLTWVAPDFNTREKAPPPCPGTSPVGGCGVPGVADLNAFPGGGGVLAWFESRLRSIAARSNQLASSAPLPPPPKAFMITHQPFRCSFGVPDFYFCFSHTMKVTLMDAMDAAGASADKWWGQLAGHQHRWYNGTSFDEPAWSSFIQWENSAVKGDGLDQLEASSFALVYAEKAKVVRINKWWTERGVWHTGIAN